MIPLPELLQKKQSRPHFRKRDKFSPVSPRFSESEKPANIEQYTNSGYTTDIQRYRKDIRTMGQLRLNLSKAFTVNR